MAARENRRDTPHALRGDVSRPLNARSRISRGLSRREGTAEKERTSERRGHGERKEGEGASQSARSKGITAHVQSFGLHPWIWLTSQVLVPGMVAKTIGACEMRTSQIESSSVASRPRLLSDIRNEVY